MDSPFPGMDPYLERHWTAVQTQLIGAASRALNRLLPPDLIARPEERLAVGVDEDESHRLHRVVPDARVFETPASDSARAAVVTAPFKLVVDDEPVVERYVKILASADERLITVIEFLSPSNKTGEGCDDYLAKRGELLDGGVNVVEIDLVRSGSWRRLLRPHRCPAEAVSEYRATLWLTSEPAAAYLYPLPLRSPLRPIPIPLRASDPPVSLDIQRLIREAYADDRYAQTLNYVVDPTPPLSAEDAAWADQLLRAAGRRK